MPTSRIAPCLALLGGLLSILAGSSCTNEAAPSGSGGATNAGGSGGSSAGGATNAGGSGGSSAGAGGATGGSAGTAGNVAGSGGGGTGGGLGGAAGTGGAAGASGAGGDGGSSFTLTSPDLSEGGVFADKYTCAAAGFNGSLSPELVWTPGPPGTQSYAITFIDVTLTEGQPPSDLGYHWVIYNIPATTLGLPEEFTDAASIGAAQNRAYLGPCPNSDTHTYEFTIYALDTETLSITPATGIAAVKDAEAKLEASHLAAAKLSGTSDASEP